MVLETTATILMTCTALLPKHEVRSIKIVKDSPDFFNIEVEYKTHGTFSNTYNPKQLELNDIMLPEPSDREVGYWKLQRLGMNWYVQHYSQVPGALTTEIGCIGNVDPE